MGKTDIVTKNYMRGSDIFADAFNFPVSYTHLTLPTILLV